MYIFAFTKSMSGSEKSQNRPFGRSSTGTSLSMEDHYVTDFASNRAEVGSSRGRLVGYLSISFFGFGFGYASGYGLGFRRNFIWI